MSLYLLERTQFLPVSLEEAWAFFSAPGNLAHITPPEMGFEVLSESGTGSIYPGQIITYYVRPLLGLRFFWMTEITHVKDREYFVDEQRAGPYSFWHHTHFFRPVAGGVEMRDQVYYKLPFGLLGKLAHALVVRQKLAAIFDFRYQYLEKRFAGN
ncbi:MAG: SRPBCC family protein [Adhaeribacter sp.]